MSVSCENCGAEMAPEDPRLRVKGGVVCSQSCRREFELDLAAAKGVPLIAIQVSEPEL